MTELPSAYCLLPTAYEYDAHGEGRCPVAPLVFKTSLGAVTDLGGFDSLPSPPPRTVNIPGLRVLFIGTSPQFALLRSH